MVTARGRMMRDEQVNRIRLPASSADHDSIGKFEAANLLGHFIISDASNLKTTCLQLDGGLRSG